MAASFDLISDLHADFWLHYRRYTLQINIDLLVDELLPTNPSNVLVIAGDLGHHNTQSHLLLRSFKRYYPNILFVFGNHDFYLVNDTERWKHNYKSMNRRTDLMKLASEIEGVVCLNGSTVTLNGITYGGAGLWYDFSFGVSSLGFSESYLYEIWQKTMNDSELIYPKFTQTSLKDFFEEECKKLKSIFKRSKVIVTHVGPDASGMPTKQQNDPISTFYNFDGSSLLKKAKDKIWCYGHTHSHADYRHSSGCRLINNALGYPIEKTGARIRTIEV